MDTIDMTPKWEAITPFLLQVIEEGQILEASEIKSEFVKMARLADKWVDHECTKPAKNASGKFREDMNIFKAVEDLQEEYIQEAFRRVGEGYGSQTRAARLLGFQSYQAFVYWRKRSEDRKCAKGES